MAWGGNSMLTTGSSGGIYIHPWDITDEGIDDCFNYLSDVCGLNELFIAAAYHANTFLLTHNPKRMVRWDDGSIYFTPQHPRWSETHIKPNVGECVDSAGYLANIVDAARSRDWGVLFFTVFHYSNHLAQAFPDCCCIDAMGERHRGYICPSNPNVRAYDLAIVEDLMATYGGDGIRHESLGFGPWNYGFVCDKVEVQPAPRENFLLSLCFCGHCLERARNEGIDAIPLRRSIVDHLYKTLPNDPANWDVSDVDEQWARNVFEGALWDYLEVRCNTVSSLFNEVQTIITDYDGAFMPFGPTHERNVLGGNDTTSLYPHMKRVSVGLRGETIDDMQTNLANDLKSCPEWAEPEMMHNQRDFVTMESLRDRVLLARENGIHHHSFHYYGMTPRYQLEWIGHARAGWA